MSASKKSKPSYGKYFLVSGAIIVLLVGIAVFGPNTGNMKNGEYFCIHTGWDYTQTVQALKKDKFIRSSNTFKMVANLLGLSTHLHPGRYHITDGMSNFEIARLLRSGKQTPVKLVINKIRTIRDFVTLVSQNMEADSTELWQNMHDPTYLASFGLDTNTAICALIPDTYDFFWNTSADKIFRKLEKNYERFWSSARKDQAKNIGYSPAQVTTIASIIEEETNIGEDKPNIASVYMNRLKKGMKLQADPTVKYAVGDFMIHRISGSMLTNPSPYNTYMYEGLPPGPICTPSPATIDAVLNAPKTNYLFFCAKDDLSGYSVFATSYEDHQKNARSYQQTLDKKGIH